MIRISLFALGLMLSATPVLAEDCVSCHEKNSPGAVLDWKASAHFDAGVGCDTCHGDQHSSAD